MGEFVIIGGDDAHGRIANWGESEKFRLKGIKPSL